MVAMSKNLLPEGRRRPETAGGLVALIGDAPHAWTMVNALRREFGDFPVFVERGEPACAFWARRTKLLGRGKVISIKLAALIAKLSKPFSIGRLKELRAECDAKPLPADRCIRVENLNDPGTVDRIRTLAPRAIFVASTGMLRKRLLSALDCPVINYHSGINPAYRGINGGYFALANGEPQHFGVTLHLVDQGVDTGGILATHRIEPTRRDNLQTYMTLMAAKSQRVVVETMAKALDGRITPMGSTLTSNQYFAPTLWQYLRTGLTRGVW